MRTTPPEPIKSASTRAIRPGRKPKAPAGNGETAPMTAAPTPGASAESPSTLSYPMSINAIVHLNKPVNEPGREYRAGSPEKLLLKQQMNQMLGEQIEIPLIIG